MPTDGETGLLERLAGAAAAARTLAEWRAAALELVEESIPSDASGLHALSPRVPLSTGAWRGFAPGALEASSGSWDSLAVELGALREHALHHGGVATDSEVFRRGSPGEKRFRQAWAIPSGFAHLAAVHLSVREQMHAVLLLLRRRGAFRREEAEVLRTLAPALAVADALHERLDRAPRRSVPHRLRCVDQRLTPRQRELVEYVALGHTNADIGAALGLSPNSVRNHLARVFARLGAANRADLVRLAVLR